MPLHLRPWQRHSQVLAVAGAVYITYGFVALLVSPGPNSTNASRGLADYFPEPFWGVVWVGVGLLALVSTRWPASSKTWGYAALAALAGWWSMCYLTAPLVGGDLVPGGVVVWALVAYLWWAVSGLVNPDDTIPLGGGQSDG